MTAPYLPPMSKSERLERAALVLIVSAVGLLAGRASFSHVVQWSMENLPPRTPISYGYTNAAISELLPVGVLLFVRYRRRRGHLPGMLAWTALIAAGLFSLTAQLAVAVPTVSGWLVAAVPTLAFMALTKLVLSMRPIEQLDGSVAADSNVVTDDLSPSVESPLPEEPTTAKAYQVQPNPQPAPNPAVTAPPVIETGRPHRVRARSLTSAAKVDKAAKELGPEAMPAAVAARAGVSESTARRYMPAARRTAPSPIDVVELVGAVAA